MANIRKIAADLAKEHTEEAIALLVDAVRNPNKYGTQNAVRAADSLLARGWGAPTQVIETSGSILDKMTPDELRNLSAALETLAGKPLGAQARGGPAH